MYENLSKHDPYRVISTHRACCCPPPESEGLSRRGGWRLAEAMGAAQHLQHPRTSTLHQHTLKSRHPQPTRNSQLNSMQHHLDSARTAPCALLVLV